MELQILIGPMDNFSSKDQSYLMKHTSDGQDALALLEDAKKGENIYGGEYRRAKETLTRIYEFATYSLRRSFIRPILERTQAAFPDLSSSDDIRHALAMEAYQKEIGKVDAVYQASDSLSSVNGMVKKLKQVEERHQSPAYWQYRAFCEKWVPVQKLIKEVKPLVKAGRRPDPKKEEDPFLSHKKTCPCCIQKFETRKDGSMVLHGYKRPGIGMTVGECIGSARHFLPLEDSLDGAYYMYLSCQKDAQDARYELLSLESGNVSWLPYQRGRRGPRVMVEPGDPNWDTAVRQAKFLCQERESNAIQRLQFYQEVLSVWFPKTYPADVPEKAAERKKYADILKQLAAQSDKASTKGTQR